jgi:hypothetical protein
MTSRPTTAIMSILLFVDFTSYGVERIQDVFSKFVEQRDHSVQQSVNKD